MCCENLHEILPLIIFALLASCWCVVCMSKKYASNPLLGANACLSTMEVCYSIFTHITNFLVLFSSLNSIIHFSIAHLYINIQLAPQHNTRQTIDIVIIIKEHKITKPV